MYDYKATITSFLVTRARGGCVSRKKLSKIEVRSTKFLLKKEKEIKFFSKIAARQRNIFANQNIKTKNK
jgi:hypothetical protein